jgi:dihydrofolate reductase
VSDITIVVAVARNGVIGRAGQLPWRLSSDLKRFKADTMGKPVIMGRKTFESIGKPLPGRRNVVISRSTDFAPDGVTVVRSLEAAIAAAREDAPVEVAVIGGGGVFAEAMAIARRLRVTHVLADVEGDTFFPEIPSQDWRAISTQDVPAGPNDVYPTRHVVYERAGGA